MTFYLVKRDQGGKVDSKTEKKPEIGSQEKNSGRSGPSMSDASSLSLRSRAAGEKECGSNARAVPFTVARTPPLYSRRPLLVLERLI